MKKLLGSFLLLVITGLPAAAMDFPKTDLSEYAPYRDQLIAEGWEPIDTDWYEGRAPYNFAEVDCGSGLAGCWAEWSSPKGTTEKLILHYTYDEADNFVVLNGPFDR